MKALSSRSALLSLIEALVAIQLLAFVPVGVKFVSANPFTIGFARLAVATLCLALFLFANLNFSKLRLRDWGSLALIGLCFGLHWISYFYSIKLSSASVGCISLSTYGIHLVILGWFIQRTPVHVSDIFAIALAFIGTIIIVPEFSLDNSVTLGILIGVLSGLVYACCPILHQRNQHIPSSIRALGQFSFALILFLFFIPQMKWDFPPLDWGWLLFLGFVSTFVAHTLWVRSSTSLSTVTTSIISYLYVPLAVLLSFLILGEVITVKMAGGAALIIGGNAAALFGQWKRSALSASS